MQRHSYLTTSAPAPKAQTKDTKKKFTHVGVTVLTQRKIALLAAAYGTDIYKIVEAWTNEKWEKALEFSVVTEEALKVQAHWVNPPQGKSQ
jgi:hypothetical protein